MDLGFTGTRNPLSRPQLSALWSKFEYGDIELLRHGACVGADAKAHQYALATGKRIVVHPPVDRKLMSLDCLMYGGTVIPGQRHLVTVLDAKPYHERNRAIVDGSEELLAVPNGPQRPHSGTWYTVLYALGAVDQHLSKHAIPVTIIWPDGRIERRES